MTGLTLDPEVRAALVGNLASPSPARSIESRRKQFAESMTRASAAWPLDTDVRVSALTAGLSAPVERSVQLRVVTPPSAGSTVVLYLHGGGGISGSAAMYDCLLGRYAVATRATFVCVDYRLAPEHPWPAALEDALSAWRWIAANLTDRSWDAGRCVVMGDSAGGGLAAGLTQLLCDRGEDPIPAAQLLVYPRLAAPEQRADDPPDDLLTWTHDDDETAWAASGMTDDRHGLLRYSQPLWAPLSTRLPRTFLEVGQLDLYRDHVIGYATRLSAGGVDVDLFLRAGAPHAFDIVAPLSRLTHRAMRDRIFALTSS